MINGIIFDLGNTLMYFDGDWEPVARGGANAMVEYLSGRGYPTPEGFASDFLAARKKAETTRNQSNIEYTAEQALSDTLTRHGVRFIPDAVMPRAIEKYFEAEGSHWVAYADARETLNHLKARGLKLGVLSNATDDAFVQRVARSGDIAEFFNPLVSSAAIGYRKPDPRAFQPILDVWQIPAPQIVMVGDAASFDILGAHRAGMRGVLIEERWSEPLKPHAEFSDAELLLPDAKIRNLIELPKVLETLTNQEQMQNG